MVFIPLTINNIFLKSSMQGSTRSVYDLSICFQALETLTERHEIADFFWELNKASVMLAHKSLAKYSFSSNPRAIADNAESRTISTCDNQEKVPFLGELPGIGKLFGTSKLTDHNTEMFIFITPTIISDPKEDLERLRT